MSSNVRVLSVAGTPVLVVDTVVEGGEVEVVGGAEEVVEVVDEVLVVDVELVAKAR
jgi:hypothetical protein